MMRAGKGFFGAPVGRLEMVEHLATAPHQLDDGYAGQSRCNFKMLWVRQTSAHSLRTLAKPRKRNWRNPRACLIWPNTGSTIVFRAAYTVRPALVCSLRFMRSTRVALLGSGPRGH